jgi:hypothetical protein
MASFGDLPPELVQRVVEFLPCEFVTKEVKSVSKATAAAARTALTKGRWRPIKLVAARGLDFCVLVRGGFQWSAASEARAHATFQAAWALDPGLTLSTVANWDLQRFPATTAEGGYGPAWTGEYQAVFLKKWNCRTKGRLRSL